VPKITVTDEDVARLDVQRLEADRAYNDALTAVDRAVARPPFDPAPPAGPDPARLPELNAGWEIIGPSPVAATGWRGRLAAVVWRAVAPVFQRQQSFNAALVDHLNRAHESNSRTRDAMAALADGLREEAAALARFESSLVVYLQQITGYVDTKDRHEAARLRRMAEHRTAGLAAGLDAVGDELLRRSEAALARERRLEARLEALRVRGAAPAAEPASPGGPSIAPAPVSVESAQRDALAGPDDAAAYAGFEDRFRGSEGSIESRHAEYLPLFAGAQDVLDIGCGRGELLRLLGERGIRARGVELNPEMVRRCREHGLDVVEGDGIAHLESLPDGAIGGLFAGQVVEHLPPDRLLHLVALAHRRLRPGGRIVLETVNVACWAAFFSSYIRDLTHVRPVHPETLSYLVNASGFEQVEIRYSSPYPAEARLQRLPQTLLSEGEAIADLVEQFNQNVDTLNRLLFTWLDYAVIGEKR
jgi:O-antigen chain-terminating methyltransferase